MIGTMWRPALRCDSTYKNYIDSLHENTILDKNQIMRLMMFVAAHSEDFIQIITEYKRDGVTKLPLVPWQSWEDALWLNQTYKSKQSTAINNIIENKEIAVKKIDGVIKVEVSSLF
ncbi:MAG TPA: hypothetical protein GX497_03615 [Bacillus bacterium]|nr:hypothetical protein [Bacillus sp. (in: firmicutes)]